MALEIKKVSPWLAEYREICKLMETAFPKEEQMPMIALYLNTLHRGIDFLAFYDEGKFCGILYIAEDEKDVFVLYLVVNNKIRSRGYGSQIIQWLKGRSDKTVLMNVEIPDALADNAVQREKRMEFYKKNEITDTGRRIEINGNPYAILSSTPDCFDADSYIKLMRQLSLGLLVLKMIE